MSHERTEAIVIKGVDFSESSRIITVLTPDRGKMACMAKGVKRPKSQLAGLLDTYNRLELVYTWKESRSVQQMVDGALLDGYTGLKQDLDKSAYGAFLLELIYIVAHENEPSEDLYQALFTGLEQFSTWTGDACTHCCWQTLRLLAAAGFAPELRACVHCGEALEVSTYFSYDGGIACENCPSDQRIDAGVHKALKRIASNSRVCPNVKNTRKAFEALTGYTARQLERNFRSVRVIDQLVGAHAR